MKTKTIEAERAGWIVKTRQSRSHRWIKAPWSYDGYYRSSSIIQYNDGMNCDFQRERKTGLARCVAVYVEASDETR